MAVGPDGQHLAQGRRMRPGPKAGNQQCHKTLFLLDNSRHAQPSPVFWAKDSPGQGGFPQVALSSLACQSFKAVKIICAGVIQTDPTVVGIIARDVGNMYAGVRGTSLE